MKSYLNGSLAHSQVKWGDGKRFWKMLNSVALTAKE